MFRASALFLLSVLFASHAAAQSSSIKTFNIGYDFEAGTTVVGAPKKALGNLEYKHQIQSLPRACFSPPGITEIEGVSDLSQEKIQTLFENYGFLYGEVEVSCGSDEQKAQLYPAFQRASSNKVYLSNGLSDKGIIEFLRLKSLYDNKFFEADNDINVVGKCLQFRLSGKPFRALCIEDKKVYAAHIYSGEGVTSYFETQRDKYLLDLQTSVPNAIAREIDGQPAIALFVGDIDTQTLVQDYIGLNGKAKNLSRALLDMSISELDRNLKVGEDFLSDLTGLE